MPYCIRFSLDQCRPVMFGLLSALLRAKSSKVSDVFTTLLGDRDFEQLEQSQKRRKEPR
eukprot:UN27236